MGSNPAGNIFFFQLFFYVAEEEDIPLDLEEIEAVSKKARQDEEIHSEHMQVLQFKNLSHL